MCPPNVFSFHGVHMSNEQTAKPTVADIVANPEAYGFAWYVGKVEKGDFGPWNVPLVRHLDVDLLRDTFGDRFWLDNADGTSRHVTNQRIARDMKADKPLTTDLAIKTAIVENMLGMKSKRRTVIETTVFSFGGVKYPTLAEMQEAAREAYIHDGYPADMVEKLVARLGGTTVNA
jgi:hypothetical protein